VKVAPGRFVDPVGSNSSSFSGETLNRRGNAAMCSPRACRACRQHRAGVVPLALRPAQARSQQSLIQTVLGQMQTIRATAETVSQLKTIFVRALAIAELHLDSGSEPKVCALDWFLTPLTLRM